MNPIDEIVTSYAEPLAEPFETKSQELQRGLAIMQQIKDSITIVMMLSTGMLLFGILFLIGIPGLVLYLRRWRLVPHGTASAGGWLWGLTLVHEFICAASFYASHPGHDEIVDHHYELGYALGVLFSVVALLNIGWSAYEKRQFEFHE